MVTLQKSEEKLKAKGINVSVIMQIFKPIDFDLDRLCGMDLSLYGGGMC